MTTIGFIGSGNMAGALIKGIIAAKIFEPCDIFIADVDKGRLGEMAGEYKVTTALSNAALAGQADTVVLSVKPQNMSDVLSEIKGAVKKDALVISIAAGVTVAKIANVLADVEIVRVMPNTPALIGQGASAMFSANASADSMKKVQQIFAAVGKAVVVDSEDMIDAVTALSGSGPAYFFLLIEEMIKAAQKLGLSLQTATELALQTAKGAAILAQQSEDTPAELRKKVTSPGGTTQAALNVFAEKKFDELVNEALTAAYNRSKELSG